MSTYYNENEPPDLIELAHEQSGYTLKIMLGPGGILLFVAHNREWLLESPLITWEQLDHWRERICERKI